MRLDQSFRNLTLVAVLALGLFGVGVRAAPADPPPPSSLQHMPAPPQIRDEVENELWRPSRVLRDRSFVVSAGLVTGLLREPRTESLLLGHVARQRDRGDETSESYGLMIGSSQLWGAHWDVSHYCCLGAWSEAYWGYGIGSFWIIEDQLASFVDTDAYHLRLRAGFEDLLQLDRRLRAELVLRASPLGFSGEVVVGWTFDL